MARGALGVLAAGVVRCTDQLSACVAVELDRHSALAIKRGSATAIPPDIRFHERAL
jgi:hypothetical protein